MSGQTFLLPDLGEGLTEADILQWLVAEGDTVAVDQPLVEVETAKSVVEVPSPFAGVVRTLHAGAGATLDVGQPLVTVTTATDDASVDHVTADQGPATQAPGDAVLTGDSGGAAARYREEEAGGSGNVLIGYGSSPSAAGRRRRPRGAEPAPGSPLAAGAPAAVPQAPSRAVADAPSRAVRVISPLVRKLARDAGLDLHAVTPSGPDGLITRADVTLAVRSASSSALAAPAPGAAAGVTAPAAPATGLPEVARRIPLSTFRKSVSAALSRSRSLIPEATVWVDVDMTPLVELRQRVRPDGSQGPGLLSYVARFVVAGLQAHPVFNARLDDAAQEIQEFDTINLGIATQGQRGLVVPAVMGAQALTTAQLDAGIREVTTRAREGRSTPHELAAGTFTLNNYGGLRVDGSAAIINHPQVAILGLGRIIDRPWVVDGQIQVRKVAQLSFVFDHRVSDGQEAAGFMRTVADALEDPGSAIERL